MHPAIQQLTHSAALVSIRQHLDAQRIVRDAVAVQQIPAPTFQESERAAFVKRRFARYPLQGEVAFDGHVFSLFLIAVAAAEAALGLALVVLLYRYRGTLDAKAWTALRDE